jgi:hypothetical protein
LKAVHRKHHPRALAKVVDADVAAVESTPQRAKLVLVHSRPAPAPAKSPAEESA